MRKRAQALPFGPYSVGKHLADKDPDDRALRKSEGSNVSDQQPDQKILVFAGQKNGRDTGQTSSRSNRPNQEKCFPAHPIDNRHGQHGEQQICGADSDRLKIARDSAKSRFGENIVQVVENRVDARKLIKCADGNRQEDGQAVFGGKQRFVGVTVFQINGIDDLL